MIFCVTVLPFMTETLISNLIS